MTADCLGPQLNRTAWTQKRFKTACVHNWTRLQYVLKSTADYEYMDWTERDCIGSPLNTTTWVHNWTWIHGSPSERDWIGPPLNMTEWFHHWIWMHGYITELSCMGPKVNMPAWVSRTWLHGFTTEHDCMGPPLNMTAWNYHLTWLHGSNIAAWNYHLKRLQGYTTERDWNGPIGPPMNMTAWVHKRTWLHRFTTERDYMGPLLNMTGMGPLGHNWTSLHGPPLNMTAWVNHWAWLRRSTTDAWVHHWTNYPTVPCAGGTRTARTTGTPPSPRRHFGNSAGMKWPSKSCFCNTAFIKETVSREKNFSEPILLFWVF